MLVGVTEIVGLTVYQNLFGDIKGATIPQSFLHNPGQ